MIDLLAPSPDTRSIRHLSLLSLERVARKLRVPVSTVADLIARGTLPAFVLGGRLVVPTAALRALQSELVVRRDRDRSCM